MEGAGKLQQGAVQLWTIDNKFIEKIVYTILITIVLAIIGFNSFLVFHSITDSICIIIDFTIFIIAINTYNSNKDSYFMFLGIAHMFVGGFDFIHSIAGGWLYYYTQNINIAAQFWFCARFIQAISLLVSYRFIYKNIKFNRVIAHYAIFSMALLSFVVIFKIFPSCYIKGSGETIFNKLIHSSICIVILFSMVILIKNKSKMDKSVFTYMKFALIMFMLSELFSIISINDLYIFNIFGAIFRVAYSFLIYKAIIVTSLKSPYNYLLRLLSNTENELELRELELELLNRKLDKESIRRKLIEQDLYKYDEGYDMLIENSIDAILIYSEGKVVFVNTEALKLFGAKSKEELIGRSAIELIHPEWRDELRSVTERVCSFGKKADGYRTLMLDSEGKSIEIEVKIASFTYRGKMAVLNIIHDISAQKKIEKLTKDVETKNMLLKETLEHNRLVSEFTANLAHELRTPLNVILGSLQVLDLYKKNDKKACRSEGKERYNDVIKQNTYRLLRLVNNLIDISKIDAGFFKLQLQNNNIISVVENITLSVAPYIESKGINITFDTDSEEKLMAFDPDKMERIILNLLSNATKFSKSGDEILVEMRSSDDFVCIVVEDSGIGIPKEKFNNIFERFMQVDKSLTRSREGSGIGLSLVKSLVELHGGDISVESEVGKGTRFIMNFPVYSLSENPKAPCENTISGLNIERINIEFSDIYSC